MPRVTPKARRVEARARAREPNVEARAAAREPNVEARVAVREPNIEAHGPARGQKDAEHGSQGAVAPPAAKAGAKRARAEMYQRLLLEAGERVFAEGGFDDAKIQDIAQAAGIALGTLYSVFPGKTEIYAAIQEQRGREILESIYHAIQGYEGVVDACMRGIDAYVRALAERPHFLRMHLREGLSWTDPSAMRSGEEVATWERGVSLAIGLLQAGIERGYLYAESRAEVVLKMMVASHQVQLQDWLDRGALRDEIEPLIARMQHHFARAFVRDAPQVQDEEATTRVSG